MLVILLSLFAAATAAPATYDQRQDGDFNVRADVQNVVLIVAVPQKLNGLNLPSNLLGLLKNSNQQRDNDIQERSDVHVMEAFVEPSTPYHVEIGTDRSANGGSVEVVIAGRRRLGQEPENQDAPDDEYKLIGAMEQCGPDRKRDPVTLACVEMKEPARSDVKAEDFKPESVNKLPELEKVNKIEVIKVL